MRSQVQNGTRNVGYVTMSAHFESARPSQLTTCASGRKRSDVGTRYVTKIPVPNEPTPKNRRRASAYAAAVAITMEIAVVRIVTMRLYIVLVWNAVSNKCLLQCMM